jgi:Fur family ferric uptake transcriptional regulator
MRSRKKPLHNLCNTPPVAQLTRFSIADSPDAAGQLEAAFLARGIRLTEQRRTILRVIDAARQCRNVGVIHRRAKRLNPQIHRVTVYRTVALLRRFGVLTDADAFANCSADAACPNARNPQRVEMKCLECGKRVQLESCMFDDLTAGLEKTCRFHVSQASITGYCYTCRRVATHSAS